MVRVVHTKIVLDIETWQVLSDESYLYEGEFAQCGGGSGGGGDTTTVDYGYNARMATIAEKQNEWAESYYNMWNKYYRPYEIAQVKENQKALPYESKLYIDSLKTAQKLLPKEQEAASAMLSNVPASADLYAKQIAAEKGLIDDRTAAARGTLENASLENKIYNQQLKDAQSLLPQQKQLASKFLTESLDGVNINERMALAQADVANAFKDSADAQRRDAARMGVNPNSGRFMGTNINMGIEEAAQKAAARTQARIGAEQENYERLGNGLQYNANQNLLQNRYDATGDVLGSANSAAAGTVSGSSAMNQEILQGLGLIRG